MDELTRVKEAISIMKEAYDVYNIHARRNLENDMIEDYWHWRVLQRVPDEAGNY